MTSGNDLSATDNADLAGEVARLFPAQGQWTEEDFFRIHTNRMAELVQGRLEVLPLPTWLHQLIVDFLVSSLKHYLQQNSVPGVVLFAPLPIRLFAGTVREPDVLFVKPHNIPADPSGYPERVDLVMEVVSQGAEAHQRDYWHKRSDYAKAGIGEYWIVDPEQAMITVMVLDGSQYQAFSQSNAGEIASSVLLPGFAVTVNQVLALGKKAADEGHHPED